MSDEFFMQKALELAKIAQQEGEVPVGAVVVKDGQIVGTGRNRREQCKNALAHAEIEAIDNACKTLGGWRLFQCDLYVTLEPCPMCTGAIINSRIKKVIYGADELRSGSIGSIVNLFDFPYNHKPEVIRGILKEDCSKILKDFFKNLRKK